MSDQSSIKSSRRNFFLTAGAAAGLSMATAAGATPLFDATAPLQEQLADLYRQWAALEDREAIRQLHLAFSALVENQAWDTVVELFADDASVDLYGEAFVGRRQGVRRLFVDQYGEQKAPQLQTGFMQDQSQQRDEVDVSADRTTARACFHARVQVCTPLTEQSSVVAQMARLQGMSAASRWENGRFEADYVRVDGRWMISRLQYKPA